MQNGQVFFKKGGMLAMKRIMILCTLVAALACPALASDDFPLTVGGITLGEDIKKYTSCCEMQLAHPMPDAPFLTEVHLTPDYIPGVRGGSLTYANCAEKGKLVRVKLKFHDRSKDLFEKLLDKYTKRYGKPDSYQGDAFKNVIAWQWDFARNGEKLDVLLMWSRDKSMRPGVSIKMTITSLFESEYECFREEFERKEAARGGPSKVKSLDTFVPK